MSEGKGPEVTLSLYMAAGKQESVAIFTTGGGDYDLQKELTSGWLISYQGNQRLEQGASTQVVTD